MDVMTKQQRSYCMSQIKKKNTKPEVAVRNVLHAMGFRYRLHSKLLPGSPDIVLPKYRTVIFVHGCFWHSHKCKLGSRKPKTNLHYWLPKLERNKKRDRHAARTLRRMHWTPITIWECETKEFQLFSKKLQALSALQKKITDPT